MGTIVSTRCINFLGAGKPAVLIQDHLAVPSKTFFDLLRSDDIFRLFGEIVGAAPAVYGLDTFPGTVALVSVILLGAFLSLVFAGWTYTAGSKSATWFGNPPRS